MFDHIRVADRTVLFLNTVLLMDIAFLPFAASVLSAAFRTGHGQRTAVGSMAHVLSGSHPVQRHVGLRRHDHRLLDTSIDAGGAKAISRRFRLALAWIGIGTVLGALLPVPRHGCDRRIHPLLLAAHPGRDPQHKASERLAQICDPRQRRIPDLRENVRSDREHQIVSIRSFIRSLVRRRVGGEQSTAARTVRLGSSSGPPRRGVAVPGSRRPLGSVSGGGGDRAGGGRAWWGARRPDPGGTPRRPPARPATAAVGHGR